MRHGFKALLFNPKLKTVTEENFKPNKYGFYPFARKPSLSALKRSRRVGPWSSINRQWLIDILWTDRLYLGEKENTIEAKELVGAIQGRLTAV